ncbi:hypothetical protein [Microvirga splendida]|nr:hypothetical protein [Microvirga splendida]
MLAVAMPDLQQELRPLAQADRHLADGAGHVAEQIALIEWMTKKGQDTTEAEKLLRNFKQILEQFRVHRRLILDAITRS